MDPEGEPQGYVAVMGDPTSFLLSHALVIGANNTRKLWKFFFPEEIPEDIEADLADLPWV